MQTIYKNTNGSIGTLQRRSPHRVQLEIDKLLYDHLRRLYVVVDVRTRQVHSHLLLRVSPTSQSIEIRGRDKRSNDEIVTLLLEKLSYLRQFA